jgi:nicotinic acid phosphoribosyltransferase
MTYPLPQYLFSVHDVALSAQLFSFDRWNLPGFSSYSRTCPHSGHHSDTIAGTEIASDFLATYKIAAGDIALLSKLDSLAFIQPNYWEFMMGLRFNGRFRHVPDGTQVVHGEIYAHLEGPIGAVILYGYAVQVLLDFAVPLATELADLRTHISKETYVRQDTTSRTFANSWSTLGTVATIIGGASAPNPYKDRGVVVNPEDMEASGRAMKALGEIA